MFSKISSAAPKASSNAPKTCGAIFDAANPARELAAIEERLAAADFWQNQADAQKTLRRRSRLSEEVELRNSLAGKLEDLGVLLEWAEGGEDVVADLQRSLEALEAEVEAAEIKKMLGGEHDRANAIVTIHPGAGGTESQDWAEMLLRMYLKWAERRGLKREVLDYQPGEEAGVKSVTYMLNGEYAFGLMSAEAGVHRLVRISPFDQAARRHTSFASVYVWPQIEEEDADIDIPDKDLRIDTYRSSGAGGQHVNVTDSAVRITHLPTGIVVSCQNERSQHKNRDVAMKVLRARLYDLREKEQQARLEQIGGAKKDIAFGSQIRSYVLQPYQMIKDHRTKYQVGDVERVLAGDLDMFIKVYLMQKASGTLGTAAADDDD
ncbi:MAG TPA: peptide chain release factor 2 [Vicinamibacterales bacterium]|nr:peptide chain release factor 2 [Vicinamibacterales bacterium]